MAEGNKRFKDTKFGRFLGKAVKAVPDLAEVAIEAVTNPLSAVSMARSKLEEKASKDENARQLLLEMQMQEREMENEMQRYYAGTTLRDRVSAREMQKTALEQEDSFSKRFLYIIALFMLISSTAFGVMLFFADIPPENKRMVEMFADIYLFGGAVMVLNFFFGGSFKAPRKSQSKQRE